MKNHYFLVVLFVAVGMAKGFTQVPAVWTASPGDINWQQVTPLGDFIVASNTALTSLDVDNGNVTWSLPKFGGIAESDVTQAANSPFLSINKNGIIYLVDPFTGEEKFNTAEAGIERIKSSDFLYRNNGILILGESPGKKEELLLVDISSGEKLWSIEEDFGRIVNVAELPGMEILVVTLFNNYRVNTQSGEVIWKKSISKETDQLASMGALGGLLKNVAEEATKDVEIKIRFWRHPSKDVFIIGSEQENQNAMSSSNMVTYQNVYYAYDMKDGSRLWNDPLKMNGKLGELVFEENTFTVLPDNGTSTKINQFDISSASGKWGKKGKGIKVKGGIYDYITTDKGYLLISKNQDKNFLSYLDINTGSLTFDKPVKINGEVVSTASLDKGILYISTKEVNILDINTGSLFFPKGIPTTPGLVAEKDGKLYLFDARERVVKAIDMTTGSINNISSAGIKFEGKETPRFIELRENGVLLTSSQNFALVGYDGKLVTQNYFKAPQEPGIARALRYAQAIRASYIGAVSYAASAQLKAASPKVKDEDEVAGAVVEGFGEMYAQLGDAATDFAKQSFKRANERFKATSDGRDFMIILSKMDKGNALLKVNKETGEVMGEIGLGKELRPVYAVDDITSQVYLKTDGKTVKSFKF